MQGCLWRFKVLRRGPLGGACIPCRLQPNESEMICDDESATLIKFMFIFPWRRLKDEIISTYMHLSLCEFQLMEKLLGTRAGVDRSRGQSFDSDH
jgi:hypothetical protein